MIRTGEDYRASIRDGRAVLVGGERVADVATHPAFRPMVDLRARLHDMAHDPEHRATLVTTRRGTPQPVTHALPFSQADWWAKRRATDLILDTAGGIVGRIGDETAGEVWALHDLRDMLLTLDPRHGAHVAPQVDRFLAEDGFLISGNADPADRLPPGAQGRPAPLHVQRETDAGIVLRGAKYLTGAAYANRAFVKPALSLAEEPAQTDRALGFFCYLGAPGLKIVCRAAAAARPEDQPLTARCTESDSLVLFDDVLIPWEDVVFYRAPQAARHLRAVLHRYSAFPFVQRLLRQADLMIGAALASLRLAGQDRHASVQDKLARLALWREGIHAHLTAAIALAERSPGGLMMPNQSLLYAGRVMALTDLPAMLHLTRELCGGQIALMPDAASFRSPETADWLDRCHDGAGGTAEDRRRLMAFARDLLNSDQAGQRLSFQLFAQSPPHAQLAALYHSFDWDGPLHLMQQAAGLEGTIPDPRSDSALTPWFSTETRSPQPALG